MFDFLQYTMQILNDKVRILFHISCTLLYFTLLRDGDGVAQMEQETHAWMDMGRGIVRQSMRVACPPGIFRSSS